MLSPYFLDSLPDPVVELYLKVEQDILLDMARRILKTMSFTSSALYQYKKIEAIRKQREYIYQELSRITGLTEKELKKLYWKAIEETIRTDNTLYNKLGLSPPESSERLKRIIQTGLTNTIGVFSNLTRTTANTASKQFENALDRAWMQIFSGAIDTNTAVKNAIIDLCKSGLHSVQYPSGHADSLDVAARRAVITGINQTCIQTQIERAESVGNDLVETSAHLGARPSHEVWQGKVFSLSGTHTDYPPFRESTGYGTGAGLGGWNCRHSFWPFDETMQPNYQKNELEEINRKKVTYNGREISLYEATQEQRRIERKIRRWKREAYALDAAGMDSSRAHAKIKEWQAKQRSLIKQTGLTRDYFRERAGAQNSEIPRRA